MFPPDRPVMHENFSFPMKFFELSTKNAEMKSNTTAVSVIHFKKSKKSLAMQPNNITCKQNKKKTMQ